MLINDLPNYDTEEPKVPKKYNRSTNGNRKTLEAKFECPLCKEKVKFFFDEIIGPIFVPLVGIFFFSFIILIKNEK